jgi:hypothetical protein
VNINNDKQTTLLSQGMKKWDFKTWEECIFVGMAWFYD